MKKTKIILPIVLVVLVLARIVYVNLPQVGVTARLYAADEIITLQEKNYKLYSIKRLNEQETKQFQKDYSAFVNPNYDFIFQVELEGDVSETKEKHMGFSLIFNRQYRTMPVYSANEVDGEKYRLFFAFPKEAFKPGKNEWILAFSNFMIEDNQHFGFQGEWNYE